MKCLRPIKAYRAEKRYRAMAQRMLDYMTANAADDGTLPYDLRGAQLVHKTPLWRATLRRTFRP